LPSCPFPSLVDNESSRYGFASCCQPRAAIYTFWNAERPVRSSGPSGFGGSAGLLGSDVHPLSNANNVSANATDEYLCKVPRHALRRSGFRCSRLLGKAVRGISAKSAVHSAWAWLDVFMASFL
jgi:hypothetical protein